jgi:DNA polymerase III subunit beta
MKLIIIKSHLKEGLSVVERTAGDSRNLPILKNVLIEAEDGKIRLTTTNLETAIRYSVSGKVIEGGRLTVPIGTLVGLINNLQGERLNLESDGNNLNLKTETYEATINGLPADDFPLVPKTKNQSEYVRLKGEILKEALLQTVIAAQFSELRPELSSVFLSFSLDNLKFAATDSFRLAEKTIPAGRFATTTKEAFNALVPLKTAHELIRILGSADDTTLYYDHNQLLFTTDRLELTTRLIDGTFPDYTAILPKEFNAELTIDRSEFSNALKLAGIFGATTNEVKIQLSDNKKTITLFSAERGLGENKYLLAAHTKGAAKETGFNWRYLLDGLKALNANEVFFGINDDNKPAIIQGVGDTSYFYILMPILAA